MREPENSVSAGDKLLNGKRVFLLTYGCQMNVRDSEVILGMLSGRGFVIADSADSADVVIFNTCSVRQHAEDKVWSEAGKIAKSAKTRPGGPPLIGIVGCMAQSHKDEIFRRAPAVSFAVGPADIDKIPGIVERLLRDRGLYESRIWETDAANRSEEIYHNGFRLDKEHAFIVISEGCSNFCSYCIVPYTRGPLRHRDPGRIIAEAEQAAGSGIKRITLLGQNVSSYSSSGTDFIGLLEKVNRIKGMEEFSFITSHPRDTTARLFQAMAGLDKCKKYLHLPAQSGSDRMLKLMNRGYSRKYYLDLCRDYRKIVVGGALTTDIIVGFSSETGADFEDTFSLLREVKYEAAFIFKYSPRPHSAAFSWQDDVPREEKERRHALLLETQKKISLSLKNRE